MTVNSFAEKEFRTPRQWCDMVDALIMHCKGDHSNCSILERYRDPIYLKKFAILYGPYHMFFLEATYLTQKRCDDNEKKREPILKQIIENNSKKGKSGDLLEVFEKGLRELLTEDSKKCGYDMCHILCSLGNTSLNEANHARVIRRGYHVKGSNCIYLSYE